VILFAACDVCVSLHRGNAVGGDQPAAAAKLTRRAQIDIAKNNSYQQVGELLVLALEGRLASVPRDVAGARPADAG
jgi:hypothetical protein